MELLKSENDSSVLISVIIVSFNAEATIQSAINSIFTQTYSSYEFILVDGLSNDNTVALVRSLIPKDVRATIISEKDNGIYDAMNKALTFAKGEWVLFLGADDTLESSALQSLSEGTLNSDIVYGNTTFVHESYVCPKKANSKEYLKYGMPCSHQSLLMRTKIIQGLGGFDLSFKIVADYDLIVRAKLAGCKISVVDKYISRFSTGGLSSNNFNADIEWYRVAKCYKLLPIPEIFLVKRIVYRLSQQIKYLFRN